MTRWHTILLGTWLTLAACRDDGGARSSRIESTRILALESEPAEVAPGQRASYRVLAVDPDGELDTADLTLSYCQSAKSPADNRLVADACAGQAERSISKEASVPSDACARFGPNVPATVRPPDPDPSGGYYQPVRAAIGGAVAVGMQRLRCQLANAPFAVTREFRERYVPNQNPQLEPLTIRRGAQAQDPEDLPSDTELTLQAGWSDSSVESYILYEPERAALGMRTETLRLSWFATDGELTYDHTGNAENQWRTPSAAGDVWLWIVLRDDRGGSTHASYRLRVR